MTSYNGTSSQVPSEMVANFLDEFTNNDELILSEGARLEFILKYFKACTCLRALAIDEKVGSVR